MFKPIAFALAATALAGAALAQEASYPSRPITLIVPFPPGGGADVIARAVGRSVSEQFRQPVVVDNKPGGSGQIGAAFVSKAKPDGYTILLATDNMYSMNPILMGKPAQDALAGLEPIVNIAGGPVVIGVAAASSIRSVQDLAAAARTSAVPMTYGTPGVSSPHQLAAEMLAQSLQVRFTHVPYKSMGQAATDLASGQFSLLFAMPASVQPLVAAGKVRIVAVTSPQRFPLMPGVPTIAETLPGVATSTIDMGLMAPKGTPVAVLKKLNEAVHTALADRDVTRIINDNGMYTLGGSVAEYERRMKDARTERERIINATGIKAE